MVYSQKIDKDTLHKFAPDEGEIYFYSPPFITVEEELKTNSSYWIEHGAIEDIDPKLSLLIGDFGFGSDTCLILDYRENLNNPKVLRLVWSDKNHWKEVTRTFDEFIDLIGLEHK